MDESVPLTLLEDATSLAARKTQILRKANASKPPNGSNASGFNRKFQGTDTMSFPFPIGAQKRDIAPAVSNPPLPAKRESVYKEQPPLSQGVSAYRDQPQATQRESVFKEQSSSPQRESIYKEQPSSPQRQSLYQMPAPAMNRSDSSLATTEVPPPSSLEKTRKASVSFVPRKSTRAENAFHHTATQRRLSHLMNTEVKGTDQLGFIFEALHDEMDESKLEHEAPTIPANPNDLLNEISPPIDPTDLKMVAAAPPDMYAQESAAMFPSLKPTTRKEVAILKDAMYKLLTEVGAESDQPYPSEMHAFLGIIQEEQKIYDTVFQEIIRQVTVNMSERGDILAELRKRYATMFVKIPRHVKHLHTELVAQRKLNRRLSEEVVRAKETVGALIKELDFVKKHDMEITMQAQNAQEKLVAVLTQSDNTDEVLEEYHRLYKMQRDRLEEALRLSEQEKRIWIDASTSLSIRIGQEHGVNDVIQLQKQENHRLRTTTDIIVRVNDLNDRENDSIEDRISSWRSKLIKLSQSVVEEDQMNIQVLAKAQREMKLMNKNLETNQPNNAIETDHSLLKVFHIYDVKTITEYLSKWTESIAGISVRYTSDRDLALQEDISHIRRETEGWIHSGYEMLNRNQKSTNGKDYAPIVDMLSKINSEVEDWLVKIEKRVSGDDGIASLMIGLQNQVEDRYNAYSVRDLDKPLPATERSQLRDCLNSWIDIVNSLTNNLANTTEKEQHRIPLHVENWLSKVVDQVSTDTDIRNEENMKLHNSIISWMVHLLVKGGKEAPSDAWDHEFVLLSHELTSFNQSLVRDSADIAMVGEDQIDLRKILQIHCDNWLITAKRLLVLEKKYAESARAKYVPTTLTKEQRELLKQSV